MPVPSSAACIGDIAGERAALIRRYVDEHGDDVHLDIDTASAYLATLGRERFASRAYRSRPGRPLVQPRGGFPSFAKQRMLTTALDEAGADFIPLTIDSHTRHNAYPTASTLLAAGLEQGRDLLNGYPLVSHGVATTRRLFEGIERPVSLRHGTPDARLLVEIALAAGITEIEGGGLSYTLPYSRAFPVGRALAHWQYVDRLCALAGTADSPVHRESFGPLTATLVPPVITIVVQLCELLLAAEQGVRSFAVSFGQTGSLEQDVAVAQVLRRASAQLLSRFGFPDVQVGLVYHQWMGPFPVETARSWSLIALSTAISRFIGADKVVVKTPDEAVGVPDIACNVAAVQAVRYVLDMLPGVAAPAADAIDEERDLIGSEVDDVLDHVFAQPTSTLLSAVQRAVRTGVIDVPFAPHEENAGRLIAGRGPDRRIRIVDPAALPLSEADLRREHRLLGDRGRDRRPLWEQLLHDIRIVV